MEKEELETMLANVAMVIKAVGERLETHGLDWVLYDEAEMLSDAAKHLRHIQDIRLSQEIQGL